MANANEETNESGLMTPKQLAEKNLANARAISEASEAVDNGTAGHVLATGRGSMSVLRGVVDEGKPIGPKDFPSVEVFNQRVAEGWIIPVKKDEPVKPPADEKAAKKQ